MTTTKKSLKFIGEKDGLYDFVSCSTSNKSIDEVQKHLELKGWKNLEYISLSDIDGYETYSL